ncbi:hypothetical protein [Enhygromyxa salina]|uniref:Uncharacterized protein n=1 Tax=Enhygromyxa salina TaxID=215803 RepID=A0A2S9YDS2_9BACT|nr:hypothetical protein [Enhygromyxa salina]PRQ03156.1 hypothetical protein ENSA7_54270 [Enhygromyxa salina]
MPSMRPLALALIPLVAACSEPEPEPCLVSNEAVIELGSGTLCTVTPTGLVLHTEGWELVLERLTEQGTLQELARIQSASSWCGTVAEDLETETIWLTVPGEDAFGSDDIDQPGRLLTLDADGQTLKEEPLLAEGAPIYIGSSLARAGELYLAGSVYRSNPDGIYDSAALIERRDANGALAWRQTGYANFVPHSDGEREFHWIGQIVSVGGNLAVFAGRSGIDSSSISMLTLRGLDGGVNWTAYVTPDNYNGPHARLASDDDRTIWVSEERGRRYDYTETTDDPPLLRVARSIVTSHDNSGWTNWRGEVEWPELDDIRVTEAVGVDTSVVHVVSGRNVEDRALRHLSLARQDWTGALECTASLDHLGLRAARTLHKLDDGRIVLGGEVVIPHEDDPEDPSDHNTVTVPAIVVLDVEPGPAPW